MGAVQSFEAITPGARLAPEGDIRMRPGTGRSEASATFTVGIFLERGHVSSAPAVLLEVEDGMQV